MVANWEFFLVNPSINCRNLDSQERCCLSCIQKSNSKINRCRCCLFLPHVVPQVVLIEQVGRYSYYPFRSRTGFHPCEMVGYFEFPTLRWPLHPCVSPVAVYISFKSECITLLATAFHAAAQTLQSFTKSVGRSVAPANWTPDLNSEDPRIGFISTYRQAHPWSRTSDAPSSSWNPCARLRLSR
jgi:hypothetical protein